MNVLSKNMFLQNPQLLHRTSLYMICNHFHEHIINDHFMNISSTTSLFEGFHEHIINHHFMNILSTAIS